MEEVVQEVTVAETHSPLMDRVIINLVEKVEYEHDMEIAECFLQLQATRVDNAMRKIEELGGTDKPNPIQAQKDPELKEFPKHLKYVFLGEKLLQTSIINSSLSTIRRLQVSSSTS